MQPTAPSQACRLAYISHAHTCSHTHTSGQRQRQGREGILLDVHCLLNPVLVSEQFPSIWTLIHWTIPRKHIKAGTVVHSLSLGDNLKFSVWIVKASGITTLCQAAVIMVSGWCPLFKLGTLKTLVLSLATCLLCDQILIFISPDRTGNMTGTGKTA